MTQSQAVIDAIESLGGIAPLGKIYQLVCRILIVLGVHKHLKHLYVV